MAIDKQNIKNKFRSPQGLPDEFSWDNMKDGIKEKMMKDAPNTSPSILGKKYHYILACTAILCSIAFFLSRGEGKQDVVVNTSQVKSASSDVELVTADIEEKQKDNNSQSQYHSHSIVIDKSSAYKADEHEIDKTTSSIASALNISSITLAANKQKHTSHISKTSDANPNNALNASIVIVGKQSHTNEAKQYLEIKNESLRLEVSNPNNILTDKSEQSQTIADGLSTKLDNNVNTSENDGNKGKTDLSKYLSFETKFANEKELDKTSSSDKREDLVFAQLLLDLKPLKCNDAENENISLPIITKSIAPARPLGRNKLYIYSGFNKGVTSFNSDAIDTLKSASHEDRYGKNIGIGWIKQLNDDFTIDISVQYNDVNSVFDYRSTPVRYEVYKQNAILGVNVDPSTGDTNLVKGEGIERGSKSRLVHWLNVQKLYTVPIIGSYQHTYRKWSVAVGAGPYISYSSSFNGRSLEGTDSVAVLDNSYMRKCSFGAVGQMGVTYGLTQKISAGVRANINMPFGSITSASFLPVRRYTWGSGLFVSYNF